VLGSSSTLLYCTRYYLTIIDSRARYYAKLDYSPAYYASVALNPEMKFDYFEQEWGKWPDWIKKAKNDVVQLWETEYKEKPQWMFAAIAPGTPDCDSGKCPPDPLRSLLRHADILGTPSWRQKKRARLAREEGDAMERFQQDSYIEMDDDAGPIGYWFRVAAGKLPYGGALAHMGLELSSIPAMCSEAERVFNRYVLLSRWSQFPPPRTPISPSFTTTGANLAAC